MKKKLILVILSLVFLFSTVGILQAGGGKESKKGEQPQEQKVEKKVEQKEEAKQPAPEKKPEVKNPDTIIYARYGTIQSLDPHRGYDTSSNEAIMNMYDTLIAYKGSSTDEFIPIIAEKVPSEDNGLIKDGGTTYIFPIKKGIKFWDGTELTPEDVEYSFERAMVTDQDGGAIWMIFEPLLGIPGSRDGKGNIVVNFNDIDKAVEVSGQNVIFHLKNPYPPFLAILAQTWSSILSKKFMIANGAWDGTLMFTAGDADIVQVDTQYWPEMEKLPHLKIDKDLPTLSNRAFFFNFKINTEANQDVWSGKLDGQGIPSDFFSDINIRKAFAYSFDYDNYIKDVYLGYGIQPASPIVKGLPYRDPNTPKYHFDLQKAKEYFQKAWDGQVWEKGFKMTIMYNTGNEARQVACQMLEEAVESLNPKFQIEIRNVDWGNYLNLMIGKKLTMFLIGWVADFPDPHNFVFPYMHSHGDFAAWQSYNNPEVDKLIEEGIKTLNPAKRKEIYYKLARMYYDDVPSFQLVQSVERHHMRDWLSGYYWNPMRDVMEYFYIYKKGY